jgi:outer membrane protein
MLVGTVERTVSTVSPIEGRVCRESVSIVSTFAVWNILKQATYDRKSVMNQGPRLAVCRAGSDRTRGESGMDQRVISRSGAWRRLLSAVAIVAAVTAPVGAQASAEDSAATVDPGPEPRFEDGRLLLSVEEAIEMALARNLGLVVERLVRQESALSLWRTEGIYDPNLTVALGAFSESSPTASNLEAGTGQTVQEQEGTSWDFGISQLFATGGRGSIAWDNSRFETNSLFATLNPSFRVDFDLAFEQPLLRDFGRDVTEYQIEVARTNVAISDENFELQVVDTLQAVIDAYWNLSEAQAQLGVAEQSLDLAQQLDEQNRIRVEVGTLAPLELVQSEAGVATREEEIIRARMAVGDAEDRLRQLLNLESGRLWETPIVLETETEFEGEVVDLEAGLETALLERVELRAKRLQQKNLELGVDYYLNQQKPSLDLSVRYGFNGLGGDITERDFITGEVIFEAPGDYGDALEQISDFDFEGWGVSLNLAYPIGNRSARAQTALAEASLDRGEAELNDLELAITTEVRRVARVVEAAAQARESARASRVLAERNLEAEQKRYENGMSTSFQVLEVQEDLTGARSREVSSIAAHRRALVQYYRSIGRLPERTGVRLDPNDG